MQTTLSMKDTDPHDIFAIEPDVARAAALAPAADISAGPREPHFGPSVPLQAAPSIASAPPITAAQRVSAEDTIRLDDPPLVRVPPATNKWAIRGFWFVFAIVSAMGATAWQHYGDRAKALAAEWTPHVAFLNSLLPAKPAAAADTASQPVAADQPVAQAAAAPSQDATAAAAPSAPVASAPDQTQLIQSMAHDIASMGQQIEQLKTSIDQLKASQDQLSQRVAKTVEARIVEPKPAPRPRVTAMPPHAAVVPPPVRRPMQAYIPPPAASPAPLPPVAAAPQAIAPRPAQPQASVVDADDGGPVVRPPLPLR